MTEHSDVLRDGGAVIRRENSAKESGTFNHPWNPASEVELIPLSRLAGLERSAVSLASLEPGKESFVLHSHHREEEWMYLLSGQGTLQMADDSYPVQAGDFIAFPTPSLAHQLTNTGKETLRYLMGGESLDHEIADFPDLGRRMIRWADRIEVVPLDALEQVDFSQSFRKG